MTNCNFFREIYIARPNFSAASNATLLTSPLPFRLTPESAPDVTSQVHRCSQRFHFAHALLPVRTPHCPSRVTFRNHVDSRCSSSKGDILPKLPSLSEVHSSSTLVARCFGKAYSAEPKRKQAARWYTTSVLPSASSLVCRRVVPLKRKQNGAHKVVILELSVTDLAPYVPIPFVTTGIQLLRQRSN